MLISLAVARPVVAYCLSSPSSSVVFEGRLQHLLLAFVRTIRKRIGYGIPRKHFRCKDGNADVQDMRFEITTSQLL